MTAGYDPVQSFACGRFGGDRKAEHLEPSPILPSDTLVMLSLTPTLPPHPILYVNQCCQSQRTACTARPPSPPQPPLLQTDPRR